MAYTRSSNIWRALIAFLRASAVEPSMVGGFHRGPAPEKTKYPLCLINPVPTPYEDTFGGDSRMIIGIVDVIVYSRNSVEADDLDGSIAATLEGADLTVDGQSTLLVRRMTDLLLDPEFDSEGMKVYPFGGTYEVWTDQAP